MAPPDFKIIIAGAGIGGLCLAYFLELAKMDYIVLERAKDFQPLGSTLSLSCQSLRVFDQLGLLDRVYKLSLPMAGFKYYSQKGTLIGRMDVSLNDAQEKRYGYNGIFVSRPELMEFLLSLVPKEKVLFGKKVLSTMQNATGVMCRLSDGTTVDGSVLVGADGAYSAVRQSLYKNMKMKNLDVPEEDMAPLDFSQFGILGVTEPMEGLPEETDGGEGGWMLTLLPHKETDCYVYVVHLPGKRLGWRVGGKMLSSNMQDCENFRQSEWDAESIEDLKKELSDRPAPLVGKVGVLFEKTNLVSRIMLEEKLFETWYEGRTVLLGDACHKMLPAGGQGANQAIMDTVCLANLLQELETDSIEDITAAFARYHEIRASHVRMITINSARFANLLQSSGLFTDLKRRLFFNYMPQSLKFKGTDAILASKPILNYVPPIPLKAIVPDTTPPMTVHHTNKQHLELKVNEKTTEPI